MRTYGQDESGKWVTIATDANGFNDAVYLTTLVQNLKLAPQESPFRESRHSRQRFSDPADYPHLYVNRLQQQFSGHFSSLQIALTEVDPPVYDISVITNSGSKIVAKVYV